MKLVAIRDRLVAKLDSDETKTKAGLIILDTVDAKSKLVGTVVSVGDSTDIPPSIKEGTRIIWEKGLGQVYETPEGKFVLLSIYDVLAIVQD